MDTHPSVASGNTHPLLTARAFKNTVFPALCQTESHLFPVLRYIKPVSQKNLVFLIPPADIFGKHTQIYGYKAYKSKRLQQKRGKPPPNHHIQKQQEQTPPSHRLTKLIHAIPSYHKAPKILS